MTTKRHTTKKQADLTAAIILLVIGIYVSIEVAGYNQIASLDIGPAFFPRVLGILLIAFAITLGFQTMKKNDQTAVAFVNRNLLIVFGLVAVFALVFNFLGFLISSVVLLTVLMKLMGAESWKKAILVSTITTIAIYSVFHTFLNVPLPLGILDPLL
jgi:putative tricarboxylic transport membrane protein